MRVIYTTKQGFKQVREVPSHVRSEEEFARGILVGPPDLGELGLSVVQKQKLNNLLVEAGLVTFPDLQRNRDRLASLIAEFRGQRDRDFMIRLLIIFQDDFYGGT